MKANPKFNIGVIGVGHWGPHLVRIFESSHRSQVVAVADPSLPRLRKISERYPQIAIHENAEAVFGRPDVDAVIISTPTSSHFSLVRTALEHGKHVFVEKPLATDLGECAELLEAARRNRRILFVGHVFVYNAGIQAVRKVVAEGALGRIHYASMSRTNLGPIRQDVSVLWDLAPHDLSILDFVLGQMPEHVSAVGARFLNPSREDVVFATYRFRENVVVNVHVSWLNPKKVREMTLVGDKKMLVWDDLNLTSPIKIYDKGVTVSTSEPGPLPHSFLDFRASVFEGDTVIPRIVPNEPLEAECNAFLDSIETGREPVTSGAKGMAVVEALLATEESLRAGGAPVRIRYRA